MAEEKRPSPSLSTSTTTPHSEYVEGYGFGGVHSESHWSEETERRLGKSGLIEKGSRPDWDLALTNVLPSRHLHKQQWANNRQTARVHEAERPQRISTVKSFRSLFRLNVYSFLSPTHLLAQRTFSTIGSTRASSFYIIVPFWMLRLLTQCLVTLCNRYRLIISIKQLNSSKNQPVISCW